MTDFLTCPDCGAETYRKDEHFCDGSREDILEQRDEAIAKLRALLKNLPPCDDCEAPAMGERYGGHFCNAHGCERAEPNDRLPWADSVVDALTFLEGL